MNIHPSRRDCYLTKLSKTKRSKTYVVFDIESELIKINSLETEHIPKLIICKVIKFYSDGNFEESDYSIFWRLSDFHNFIDGQILQHKTIHLLSHNANYDMTVGKIFKYIEDRNFICKSFHPLHGSFFCHFKKDKNSLILIDSLNWFTDSLENIGKEIGMKKLKMPKGKIDNLQWIKYCSQDVAIVIQAMKELSKYLIRFSLGDLRITRASIAFSVFRIYFHSSNMRTHNDIDCLEHEYNSYFGGRTELLEIGKLKKQTYYMVDFNSLYPSVMKDNLYSVKLRRYFPKSNLKQLKLFIQNYGCIAKVKLNQDKPYFPLKTKTHTLFPTGKIITTLSTPELKRALELNLIDEVISLSVYYQKEIFSNYVDYFHKLKQQYKQENKKVFTYITKLLLNTLYGKLGQKISTLEDTGIKSDKKYAIEHEIDLKKRTFQTLKIINGITYREKYNLVARSSIPSIVSEVTSYARVKMLDAIKQAGWENCYYMDTDSLILNKKGLDNLSKSYLGNSLGKMVMELKSSNVILNGVKDYTFGKKVKLKSVPYRAKRKDKNTYIFEHFLTTREILMQPKNQVMKTVKRQKVISRKYHKGVIQKNNRVYPFNLSMY